MVGDISNVLILTEVMVPGWHREGTDMKRVHGVMRITRVLALIGVLSLWANSQSKGAALNLVPTPGGADFTVSLGVSYSSDTLQVISEPPGVGQTVPSYSYNFLDPVGFYGDFTLVANITSAGILNSGTFTLNGDMMGSYGLLLKGDLNTGADGVAFGSKVTGDPNTTLFEFPFTVTGGDPTIVSNFGGPGSMQGSVELTPYFDPLSGDVPFVGWSSNFNNTGPDNGDGSIADVVVVPEPSSIVLVLVGCMVFVGAHRATATKRGCV